MSLGNKPK